VIFDLRFTISGFARSKSLPILKSMEVLMKPVLFKFQYMIFGGWLILTND